MQQARRPGLDPGDRESAEAVRDRRWTARRPLARCSAGGVRQGNLLSSTHAKGQERWWRGENTLSREEAMAARACTGRCEKARRLAEASAEGNVSEGEAKSEGGRLLTKTSKVHRNCISHPEKAREDATKATESLVSRRTHQLADAEALKDPRNLMRDPTTLRGGRTPNAAEDSEERNFGPRVPRKRSKG